MYQLEIRLLPLYLINQQYFHLYQLFLDLEYHLFLQHQNRRGMTEKEKAHWDSLRAKDPRPSRRKEDWRKPASLSDEEWRKFKRAEKTKKKKKTKARIAKLKEKQPPKKPKVKGYKGHVKDSRLEKLHRCHDEKGVGAATKLGQKLGLSKITLKIQLKKFSKEEV